MGKQHTAKQWFQLLIPSTFGVAIFFVPVSIGDKNTILLDHFVIWAEKILGDYAGWYALFLIIGGCVHSIKNKFWQKGIGSIIFALFKFAGIIMAAMVMTKSGPVVLYEPFMLEFLWKALVIPVAILVPIGALFMPLLVNYGLVELAGGLSQPFMRRLFHIPGRSAIDAVASFVTSFAVGLLITNKAYLNGEYSAKEAAIIATGFSTVSVAFMVIVARTLDLMDIWSVFFIATLITTIIVTAISARLPPISRMSETAINSETIAKKGERLKTAINEAIRVANQPKRPRELIKETLQDGLVMTMTILPTILSIGTLSLLIEKYTPVFDWVGYAFYPITLIFGIDNGLELSAAVSTSYSEMFLPALIMAESDIVSRLVSGIVAISSILFVAASIPCIMATQIPLSFYALTLIWFIRTALSMLVSIPLAMLISHFLI
ncbi:YjiH family protein [Moraxella catarrhalis]|uniref:Putative histidine uptake transporter n=1 Tax=Moraxella catarrhalis TaxID=480 RepID=A0A198UJI3_MORCA|nr:YjiH family protein [Moraxella catarrhalis]OAU96120.1 putative histidine uptake transporter [Moraxella catarrhalis]OAU96556.1 putative histidine uptake transporter [Moraxella catarrhalis]OAU99064.1 putative histidine uptake transporter [Moraxella catarrhalis]